MRKPVKEPGPASQRSLDIPHRQALRLERKSTERSSRVEWVDPIRSPISPRTRSSSSRATDPLGVVVSTAMKRMASAAGRLSEFEKDRRLL